MKAPRDPGGVKELQRRLNRLAGDTGSTVRRLQSLVANVVVCQMLPGSAVKGGTGIKLRLGDILTRQTPDLDTTYRGDLDAFEDELRKSLAAGWGHFTGGVTRGVQRPPGGVPAPYVMQPFTVKLQYHHRSFATVDVEVGYDELEATSEPPELQLSSEVLDAFAQLGLAAPAPVAVLPLHHQISQKLHACTEPGNERAHDLVDLQLVAPLADDALVADTVQRLFRFRAQHRWPAAVITGPTWASLYADAAEGLDVLPTLEEAVHWVNSEYIPRLAAHT